MSQCSAPVVGGLGRGDKMMNDVSIKFKIHCTSYDKPILSLVTLETRSRALVADDGVLDETSAVGGDHHSLGRLGLDGQGRLAVGLNQGVDWEALGLHGYPLGVHLH